MYKTKVLFFKSSKFYFLDFKRCYLAHTPVEHNRLTFWKTRKTDRKPVLFDLSIISKFLVQTLYNYNSPYLPYAEIKKLNIVGNLGVGEYRLILISSPSSLAELR